MHFSESAGLAGVAMEQMTVGRPTLLRRCKRLQLEKQMEIFFPQVKKPKFLRAGKIQIRGSFSKDLTTYLPNEIWLRILMKLDQLSLGRYDIVHKVCVWSTTANQTISKFPVTGSF